MQMEHNIWEKKCRRQRSQEGRIQEVGRRDTKDILYSLLKLVLTSNVVGTPSEGGGDTYVPQEAGKAVDAAALACCLWKNLGFMREIADSPGGIRIFYFCLDSSHWS